MYMHYKFHLYIVYPISHTLYRTSRPISHTLYLTPRPISHTLYYTPRPISHTWSKIYDEHDMLKSVSHAVLTLNLYYPVGWWPQG